MTMPQPLVISAAVEGMVDEDVVKRLIVHVGAQPGPVYGKNGKPALRQKLNGYNNAARRAPWLVLVDLDNDADCAPPFRQQYLSHPAPFMCFRIAVRAVEAWLMADPETLAKYLGVARSKVPAKPEALPNPKDEMVNLARQSRRRAIREDMVPRPDSGRRVGPAYTCRVVEYVQTHWRPEIAAARSDSLRRAIACLERLVEVIR